MKIKIDFDKKIIELGERVELSVLFDKLNYLFPNNEWKKYSIETNTMIHWVSPVWTEPYNPFKPWEITSDGSGDWIKDNITTYTGVHNIEIV